MAATTPQGRHLGALRGPITVHPQVGIHVPLVAHLAALPPAVDNSRLCPPVGNQQQQGSCTGWAHSGLHYAAQVQSGAPPYFIPSPAFNYAEARAREHALTHDSGANPYDNLLSLVDEGLCAEKDMPYNPAVYAVAPTAQQLYNAKHHRLLGAALVAQDLGHLKSVLAFGLGVFTFAIDVFLSTEQAPYGDVPMPGSLERSLGGHDLFAYGYHDDVSAPGGGWFLFQNSWGTTWGNQGRGRIPYAYLLTPQLAFLCTTGRGIKR